MDLFFEVLRHKTHIFIDAKETHSVLELKKIIEGILKVSPENQRLHKMDEETRQWQPLLDNDRTLQDVGFGPANAKAQQPAPVALILKDGDTWEEMSIEPLSVPPPLPDVMRAADQAQASSAENVLSANG